MSGTWQQINLSSCPNLLDHHSHLIMKIKQKEQSLVCTVCGGILLSGALNCDYDKPESQAPWVGDYEAMNKGVLTHQEHLLIVARWSLHTEGQGKKIRDKFLAIAKDNWGKEQRLHLLDDN